MLVGNQCHLIVISHIEAETRWPPVGQMTFANAISSMKMFQVSINIPLFLRVQLTISDHWLR